MYIELAHFSLILALPMALLQAVCGLRFDAGIAQRAAVACAGLVVCAFAGLTYAYATSDFSVLNVVLNSHSLKPMIYKISGVWGNHEGSMLLWILILTLFGAAMIRIGDPQIRRYALGVQGLIATGFIAFSLFTSNPFIRVPMPPPDGNSLNPVLQDPGLAFHPPSLYFGYVGFSSVFSLAAAALLAGRIDQQWARMTKPFVALAWLALSAGIALGSKWAYYELGWGGWWFWDPVENASLLPWLAGTALLHSLLVLEARGALKRWTILLAIVAFSCSLIGTFIVRSGVLASIHAFAVDPARGIFILLLLVLYCGGAFTIYALRAPQLKTLRLFTPISRESSLVFNNLILVTMAATILTGTLYPLLIDALALAPISVGPPYYNATVVMMALPLLILMGAGPFLPWKRPGRWAFKAPLTTCALLAVAAMLFISKGTVFFGAGIWLISASVLQAWQIRKNFNLKSLALFLGHFGLGLAVIGMIGSTLWKLEDIRVMKPGDTMTIGRHILTFQGVKEIFGPNYGAYEATLETRNGPLHPQKRWYPVSGSETTEAAIRLTLLDDIYVVLGDRDAQSNDAWIIRAATHPFVAALWGGFALIVFAGVAMLMQSLRRP